jgi:hypothetical protein
MIEYPLIVYTDEQTATHLKIAAGGSLPEHVMFIDIQSVNSAFEKYVDLHVEIMGSESYQSKIPDHRKDKAEHNHGEYTALVAGKVDYVKDAHDRYPGYSYYSFIDFSYTRSDGAVPKEIDASRLLPNKIMFAMMSLPDIGRGKELTREQLLATDKIFAQGGAFIVPNMMVEAFYDLWVEELDRYHQEYLVDDDQSIVYGVMVRHPQLFVYVRPFKWMALFSTYLNKELMILL